MREFYRHFAQAYGTILLVVLAVALVTWSDIDTGLVGLIGFPAASLVYAIRQTKRQSGDDARTPARQSAH